MSPLAVIDAEPPGAASAGPAARLTALVTAEAAALNLTEVGLRARLVEADMLRCQGNHAEAGRIAQDIRRWATENERPHLRARSAFVLAAVFQELGDLATALELAVDAVEL